VEVWQIVQYPTISQKEKADLTQQLQTLKTRIQNGESFEELAKKYSQDPGSAPQGGELGFWRLGELAPAYEEAALSLKLGEISAPVETQFGLHLIQLIAYEKGQYNSRHILLKPNPQSLDIAATQAQLAHIRTDILAGQYTFDQPVQKISDDDDDAYASTDALGSSLTSHHGNARMPIDELPAELFFAIEHLTPGTISEPTVFTTPDGQQAVRLLYLKEKILPHQATLEQDYDKLQQLVINQKRANALQAWFNNTKANVTIHVAPEYQQCELLN
ncbi:MAG: peptidylprolyl isomerase, partial [Bacteroidota bacterium]